MTELTVAPEAPVTDSTVLDTAPALANKNGGGAPTPEPEKPESVADSIRSVIKEADEREAKAKEEADDKGEKAKADAQAEVKEKTEPKRGEGGKFAKAEPAEAEAEADKSEAPKPATERAEPDDKRPSEGRKYAEPPARFLPEARTKWANVPNEVKAEFHRVSQEYEAEVARSKQTTERYESIRQFDEQARANGRELKDSLVKMVQIEQALARNPVMGLEAILREIGPRKADGSPVSLYEIAAHVAKLTPQQYQANMGQVAQAPRQQQADPKVAQLEQTVQQLQSMIVQQQANPIIANFAATHPDYHQLEGAIANVLKSGIIEQLHGNGLTPEQRLEQAYRIAGGTSPSHVETSEQAPTPVPAKDRPVDPAGQKSITGALNARGDDPDDADDADTDIRSLLKKGLRRAV